MATKLDDTDTEHFYAKHLGVCSKVLGLSVGIRDFIGLVPIIFVH